MKFDEVRTRFAPSPTGYMHVGNLRTALYAYLTAKSSGGKMILRIEDTDQERQVEGAVDIIYNTMRDTGLLWDEGPDIGGPVGPYVQSERMAIYKEYALKLVEKGAAYYCFCGKERLEEVRELQKASGIAPQYDRHCRNLTREEVEESWPPAPPMSSGRRSRWRAPPPLTMWSSARSPSRTARWTTRCCSRPTACPPTTLPMWWTTT